MEAIFVTRADQFGVGLHGAPAAVQFIDAAMLSVLRFRGDPIADLDRAIASDPRCVMAYVLKALLYGLSTERPLVEAAKGLLEAARRADDGGLPRETRHVTALAAWLDGRFFRACTHWEAILVDHPNDAAAMFAAHQADFFLGQSGELRDRVARRLPELKDGSPLQGYYRGMQAFGLEEMGAYAQAAAVGMSAVDRDPRDVWAIHAVSHVFEMTNDIEAGIEWLASRVEEWQDSGLAVHLWWHLALYHCDREQWDRVLELFDAKIRRKNSTIVMELLDATALLWRLALYGVDVGDRWQDLALAWEPRLAEGWYAFNDLHAMMAFVAAERFDLASRLLDVLRAVAGGATDNAAVTGSVALPVAEALLAYARNDHCSAVTSLEAVRMLAVRAGGSHAQRDLLSQTLLAAAIGAGQASRARALLNERVALRPHSLLNQRWLARVAMSSPQV